MFYAVLSSFVSALTESQKRVETRAKISMMLKSKKKLRVSASFPDAQSENEEHG